MTGRQSAARFLSYLCDVKKTSHIIIVCLFIFLVVCVVASLSAGCYMVKYALLPEVEYDEQKEIDGLSEKFPGLSEWVRDLMSSGALRDTSVIIDGLVKHCYLITAQEPSAKTAVTIHGYTSNPMAMMPIARMFRDEFGYNVALPHLHYHGFSEGASVQMGWYDRLDVLKWIDLAHEVFSDTLQVVHGISMGGATTMMTSGEDLPEYVRGFIEDCGYSTVWEQYKKELAERFHLPAFPILYAADLVTYLRYGWHFKEASSLDQLSKSTEPMLFIHGDSDKFVPSWMLQVNYDAKKQGYKEMWSTPGVPHAESYHMFPEEYSAHVGKFLKEHVEQD